MHADSFFTAGRTHAICQDYARAGRLPGGRPVALVADGCSGSPDSDFGARLLVMAALSQFGDERPFSPRRIATRAQSALSAIPSLAPTALDSTLLALVQNGDAIEARAVGDGVIAARRRDGAIDSWVIKFKPGANGRAAAAYPTYLLDPERMGLYADGGFHTRTVERGRDGMTTFVQEEILATDESEADSSFTFTLRLCAAEYDFVAVFSDGIESFRDQSNRAIPVHDVLREVMAVRASAGEFVARRCRRFLQQCRAGGLAHDDDFSMAALWCRED